MTEENIFYVYAYLDTRKPGKYQYGEYVFNYEPFYIGKGKNYRQHDHLLPSQQYMKGGNILKKSIIKKIINETKNYPLIIKISENINEYDSFTLETKLIKIIGRRDIGKGPLANMTDGGEGNSGKNVSKKTRKKLSVSIRKYYKKIGNMPENSKEKIKNAWTFEKRLEQANKKRQDLLINGCPMTGKHHTDETKRKLSEINSLNCLGKDNHFYGKHHTEETKQKLREKNGGEKHIKARTYKVKNPQGEIFIIKGFRDFCKKNGLNRMVFRDTMKRGKPIAIGKNKGWQLLEVIDGNIK